MYVRTIRKTDDDKPLNSVSSREDGRRRSDSDRRLWWTVQLLRHRVYGRVNAKTIIIGREQNLWQSWQLSMTHDVVIIEDIIVCVVVVVGAVAKVLWIEGKAGDDTRSAVGEDNDDEGRSVARRRGEDEGGVADTVVRHGS